MVIIVDTNEQATNPEIVKRMKKSFPDLIFGNLEYGDVNIILDNGSILAIERKNADDYLASIGDGRLFKQIEGMANCAKFYCIMLIGTFEFDEEDMVVVGKRTTGWRGASVRAASFAIQFSGCPIIPTTYHGYCDSIMEVVEFVSKPDKHYQHRHNRSVTFPPADIRLDILSSFPGVGFTRAKALMDFVQSNSECKGTLAEAFAWASAFPLIPEQSRPEGWGTKTVLNFRTALGLGPTEYLDLKEGE